MLEEVVAEIVNEVVNDPMDHTHGVIPAVDAWVKAAPQELLQALALEITQGDLQAMEAVSMEMIEYVRTFLIAQATLALHHVDSVVRSAPSPLQ